MKAHRKAWSERHRNVVELVLLVVAVPLGEYLVEALHRAVEVLI